MTVVAAGVAEKEPTRGDQITRELATPDADISSSLCMPRLKKCAPRQLPSPKLSCNDAGLSAFLSDSRRLERSVAFVFEIVSSDTFPPLTWPLLSGKPKG